MENDENKKIVMSVRLNNKQNEKLGMISEYYRVPISHAVRLAIEDCYEGIRRKRSRNRNKK